MDGLRAKRLKIGSALGRVIDEAGDIIPQACYQFLLAKAFGWQGARMCAIVLGLNTIFFLGEMSH